MRLFSTASIRIRNFRTARKRRSSARRRSTSTARWAKRTRRRMRRPKSKTLRRTDMADIAEIRHRIKSVQDTHQITKAMELISGGENAQGDDQTVLQFRLFRFCALHAQRHSAPQQRRAQPLYRPQTGHPHGVHRHRGRQRAGRRFQQQRSQPRMGAHETAPRALRGDHRSDGARLL